MKKIHIPDDATATVNLDSEVLRIIQSLTEFDSLVSNDELIQILKR
jgi:hypothetical protein